MAYCLVAGKIRFLNLLCYPTNQTNMEIRGSNSYQTNQTFSQKLKKLSKPLIGTGMCAITSLIFAFANVLVKELSHVNFFMISCVRFYVMTMMSSPVTMQRMHIESPFPHGKRWLLFLRSIVGATNLIINFYGLQV